MTNRKKTVALWNRDPHCYWCGKVTVLSPSGETLNKRDDIATFDHLFPRGDAKRDGEFKQVGVLCCRKCNNARNKLHTYVIFPLETFPQYKERFQQAISGNDKRVWGCERIR